MISIEHLITLGFLVLLQAVLGFDNLFDWIGIFEQAVEIHTAETAVTYILNLHNQIHLQDTLLLMC